MGYIPSYNSIYDSASVQVDTRTVSNNTIENFEENAKSVGVNVDRDVNGNLIGYSTNQTVTSYENGEYVERTIKIPLTATVNPNSTNENLIIDYVPSNTYTTTDNEHYEPGSVNYVMDKNEYLKGVMSANGYELDIDQIDTSILDALWEAYNQDVTHHSGLIHNPIVEALGDAAGIDPSIVESDTMALARLKISDLGLKFLDSDTNVARILKAAASVGMTTVGDVIEDDPATREYADDFAATMAVVSHPDLIRQGILAYRDYIRENEVKVVEDKLLTKGDSIFQRIIEPYKGNVLYVDFWEMSCGPCRAGMLRMRDEVEANKDKPVKYLYVTDDTPEHCKSFLEPNNIQGEHIHITRSEWGYLQEKFQFSGIPFIVLYDKQGKRRENVTVEQLLNEKE